MLVMELKTTTNFRNLMEIEFFAIKLVRFVHTHTKPIVIRQFTSIIYPFQF